MVNWCFLGQHLLFKSIVWFDSMVVRKGKFPIFQHLMCCKEKVVIPFLLPSIGLVPKHKQPQNSHSRILLKFGIESNDLGLNQHKFTRATVTKADIKYSLCMAGVITSSACVSISSIILLDSFLLLSHDRFSSIGADSR